MRHYLWIISFLLIFSLPSVAAPSPLRDYFRESMTTREGLPHNTINDIAQSGDGYLWLATWEGAARFDGRSFRVFARGELTGLSDSGVRAFWQEPTGELLLGGARGGLSQVAFGRWTPMPAVGSLINDLHRDKTGQLWIATEGMGLIRQTVDGRYQPIATQPSQVVYRVLSDADGQLWLATDQGLFQYDLGKQQSPRRIGSEQGLPSGAVNVLIRDQTDQLLVGTEHGLYQQQGAQFVLVHPQLAENSISAVMRDSHNALWIGTVNHGLFRLTDLGLEQITVEHGLPNNRVLALFEDREGSIWVGTNGGLMRLRDTPFTTLTIAQGLSDNYVRTVLEHSDGSLWIGSSNGLDQQVGEQIKQLRMPNGNPVPSVLSLAEGPEGDIWVGTYTAGLLRFRNNLLIEQYLRNQGLGSNEVRAIFPISSTEVWIGTSGGLTQLQGATLKNFTTQDGLPSQFVSALMRQADGTLWIGTGKGLAKMFDEKIEVVPLTRFDNAEYIFAFLKLPDSPDFWVASDRGMLFFNNEKQDLTLIGREQGLPFDKVFSVLRQDHQYFWLSSNRGILRIDQRDVQAVLLGQEPRLTNVDLFGEPDGMLSAQCNGGSMPAAVRRKDGSLWFATAQGAVAIDPVGLAEFSLSTPTVVVQGMTANGVVIEDLPSSVTNKPVASNESELAEILSFAAGTRRVTFDFAGLSYLMPSRIVYRTQLIGFDADWIDRGNSTDAEYTNLQPGHYQFMVSAAYPDGQWSQPALLSFEIQPHLWQRLEFIILLVMFVFAMIYAAYHLRIIHLHRREQQLALLVSSQTSELQKQTAALQQLVIEKTQLATLLRQQSEALAIQANHDGLTGLANRRAFDERLSEEFARAQRLHHSLCLVMLDIDFFKRINDQWSHGAGDQVLKRVADILTHAVSEVDLAARWGGEEFVLLLPEASLQQGLEVAEKLRQTLVATDFSDIALGLKVTASFGVVDNSGYIHYEKMLSKVDSLLYQAKKQGRNQVCS